MNLKILFIAITKFDFRFWLNLKETLYEQLHRQD
jgi:hypothetical protein